MQKKMRGTLVGCTDSCHGDFNLLIVLSFDQFVLFVIVS